MKQFYFKPGLLAFALVLLLGNTSQIFAQAPYSSWVKSMGSTSNDNAYSAVDSQGNSYVAGHFFGSMTLGTTTLKSSTGQSTESDVFICKYDTNGNLIWSHKAGGSGNDLVNGIALDNDGNIWIIGEYRQTAEFLGTSLTTTNPNYDAFILKINPSGEKLILNKGNISDTGFIKYITIHIA